MADLLVAGLTWPPEEHRARLTRYKQNKKLFKGDHKEVYPYWAQRMAQEQQDFIELIINFPGMLSKLSADLLFGEFPVFKAGVEAVEGKSPDDTPEQQAINRLVEANKLHRTNYEMAVGNSYRGDSLYKVRFGKRTKYAEKPEAIINEVPPAIWFPVASEDDVREVEYHVLAWQKQLTEKQQFVRAELHYPGRIENQLWVLKDGGLQNRVSWQQAQTLFPEYAEISEVVETQIPFPLVVHVPNFAIGDEFYGIDDYMELDTLFQEMNARVSQVSLVLNKHADPNMYGPDTALETDIRTGQPRIRIGGKFFPVGPGEEPPGYVTWDGKLEAAFQAIDKLVEMIFYVSDTSPTLFGFEKSGGAQSGTALRLRLIRTLAKINRKRIYFDDGLKQALYLAQLMEAIHGRPPETYDPVRPTIGWKDGLPTDAMEQAQIEQIRTGGKATSSVKSAIQRLDSDTDEEADAELDRIKEEQEPPPMAPRVSLPPGPGGAPNGQEGR